MRPEEPVWRCFGPPMKKAGEKSRIRVCKGCGAEVRSLSCRARNHADKCRAVQAMGLWTVPGSPVQSTLASHVVATPQAAGDKLQLLVATFVYGNNLPFCVADNCLFRNLVSTLRPGFQPPASRSLSGTLLEQVWPLCPLHLSITSSHLGFC